MDEDHSCHQIKPAAPVLKTSTLPLTYFYYKLRGKNKIFVDRKLPQAQVSFSPNSRFDQNYYITLSNLVSAPGPTWGPGTPNHIGARIGLRHTTLNLDMWRKHLIGYKDIELCQYLEFGFPLGLRSNPPVDLVPASQNHGSSYQFYPWVDEFISSGVENCFTAGPCGVQPFSEIHISPLMTSIKKPSGRRCVFDATYGDCSLNNNTPTDVYQDEPIEMSYPKIEDFRALVLRYGPGCYLWKRDLSSFFLQIPLDPVDYPKVIFIWRGFIYFFLGLMFGLRHSGYQGQRLTDAVSWVHGNLGLETDMELPFNSLNYSDDIGGCEGTEARALQSSQALAQLFIELGLKESTAKYHPPSTSMPFLGVQFDTVAMTMSVPPEKLEEVRAEVALWSKKSTATKKNLQQLLGRLFWISRCVKFSRPFMGRLLQQLRDIHSKPENKKFPMSDGCKQDIMWWKRYLRRFNGVELVYNDTPMNLSLIQLLDSPALVNCGDAQMWGGGAYFGQEYWSRPFPTWLQNPEIKIHMKEFYVVLASAWLWADQWTGKLVYIFSDNDAVVESLSQEKPRNQDMLQLVREFSYLVCTKRFTPVFRKIGTKDNWEADFISRCHDQGRIANFYTEKRMKQKKYLEVPDNFFDLGSNW